MRRLGYIVMMIGCVMLLGFVGHDECNPGGDFKVLLVKLLAAAFVVATGLFLSGVRRENRSI